MQLHAVRYCVLFFRGYRDRKYCRREPSREYSERRGAGTVRVTACYRNAGDTGAGWGSGHGRSCWKVFCFVF